MLSTSIIHRNARTTGLQDVLLRSFLCSLLGPATVCEPINIHSAREPKKIKKKGERKEKRKEHDCPASKWLYPTEEPRLWFQPPIQGALHLFKHAIVCKSEQRRLNSLMCNCPRVKTRWNALFFFFSPWAGRFFFPLKSLMHYASSTSFFSTLMVQRRGAPSCPCFPSIAFWLKSENFSYFSVISWP